MLKRLAIIPARGGSKRILNKNIKNFCGKPIISYSIDFAVKSKLFNKIHISTDCEKIKEFVSRKGFPPEFDRPSFLAEDHSPLMPVMKYVLEQYKELGEEFDQIWLITACSPLVEAKDLISACKLFERQNAVKPVMSVSEFSVPIEWAYEKSENQELKPLYPGRFAIRSQDLEKKYFDTGNFIIFSPVHILSSSGAGSNQNFIGFELNKSSSIDIDDNEDWSIAEAIYNLKVRNKKET